MDNAAKKRIEIAKDALSLLEAGEIVAISGRYLVPFALHSGSYCQSCAVGALIVAVKQLSSALKLTLTGEDVKEAVNILEPFFEKRQLALIEASYEADQGSEQILHFIAESDQDTEVQAARVMFGPIYYDTDLRPRLVSIMNNIIENNGTFVVYD